MSDNLYFSDLPIGSTEEQIKGILGAYGTIQSIRLLVKPGLKPHALIRYGSAEEAAWIVENLAGNIPEGLTEPIQVNYAKPKSAWAGGMDGGKGAWGGGMDGGKGAWGGGMDGGKGAWGAGMDGGKGAWGAGMGGGKGAWGAGMDAWSAGLDAWDSGDSVGIPDPIWGGMYNPDVLNPCKGGCKGGSWGPYGKGSGGGFGGSKVGGGGAPKAVQTWAPAPSSDSMPEVIWLEIDPTSQLVQSGFASKGAAIEHSKLDIFSEAHYWCQGFFMETLKDMCKFVQDEGNKYPEIYQAWKAAGKEDNWPMVATCPQFGVWGVGFGGKKNAERAAKLALATVLARTVPPTQTAEVIGHYPDFGEYLQKIGALV